MLVRKIIERAEKYRGLGRFDKRSAVSFLNDALYEVSKRQSITIVESFYSYVGERFKPEGILIKFISASSEEQTESKLKIMNDGSMNFFYQNENQEWIEHDFDNYPELEEIKLEYVGFIPVKDDFSEVDTIEFPSEFETSLVYFIRSKMLEESSQFEESNYFMNQFNRELISKSAPKRDIISKPSEFSLL